MKRIFRDEQGAIRNGWWILAFLAVFLASQPVYRLASRALKQQGLDGMWLSPLPFVVLLAVTCLCLRARRETLGAIGLRLDARWFRDAALGVALGGGLILLVTGLIAATGGVRLGLDPARGAAALLSGAWLFLWVVLLEELLFRGFVFQRLIDGIGARAAIGATAVLFAVAHWGNPGLEGASFVVATVDTALGAVLLGLAYLRTSSLALPIGIHFGWNWVQGSVLGFDVSGLEQAGWLLPRLLDQPQWMTGGAFGPEASVFAVLVDGAAVLALWRWKGVARARPLVLAPAN